MIRHTVRVGQEWSPNDPRRFAIARVTRILNYRTGRRIDVSIVRGGDAISKEHHRDRVQLENLVTGRRTTVRRDQFMTGIRGWSLHKEAPNVVRQAAA